MDLTPSPCFNSLSYDIRRVLAELLDRSAILKLFVAVFTLTAVFFCFDIFLFRLSVHLSQQALAYLMRSAETRGSEKGSEREKEA
jgi:hypothetical protein